jgi:hypothetical protein
MCFSHFTMFCTNMCTCQYSCTIIRSVSIITTVAMLNYVYVKIIFIFKYRHSFKVNIVYPHSDNGMADDGVAVLKWTWRSWIHASWHNYENNQQDALFRLIYYSKSALHVSGDVFVHHQEHLTVFTVLVNTTRYCKYSQMLLMMGKNITWNMKSWLGIII